jgi:2-keto-4-pentenoate hydratase
MQAATIAAAVLSARRRGPPYAPLAAEVAPRTLAEGLAAQVALARMLDADPPAGFKIGATAAGMRAYLGLEHPLAGFMPREGLVESGAVLPWPGAPIGVECEIGVRLAHDLPPGPCDAARAAAAVADVFAAIEIVENRYGPPPAGDLKTVGPGGLLADQVFHRGGVLGKPAGDWRALDLAAVPGRMRVDGQEMGHGTGADLLGHPMAALAWLAGSAEAAAFGGLRAGQVVLLGSVTPPIWLEGPCAVEVTFMGLGEASVAFA